MATKGNSNAVTKVTTAGTQAATKITKATEGLSKIVSELTSLNDNYEELIQNIELKQADFERLSTEYQEKQREMEADLKLRSRESAENLVNEILKSQGKVSISSSELRDIQTELETTKANFDKNVKAEVDKMVGILSSQHKSDIRSKELEFAATSAEMKAQLSTASNTIESLKAQVEDYKSQIEADRQARVQEAQARGGQSIVVQSDAKR